MAENNFDALIFDVDGVLLDVAKSFPEVIRVSIIDAFSCYCNGEIDSAGYTPEHEKLLKLHGAFNDDYNLAWALTSITAANGSKQLSKAFPTVEKLERELKTFSGDVKSWVTTRYGRLIPYEDFRAHCNDLYLGTKEMPGLHLLEKPLLNSDWSKLPRPAAIYTGRDLQELTCAFESLHWQNFPTELVVHRETGICKPSPKGLQLLCEKLNATNPLYFGDTASDLIAFNAFGKGSFVAIGNMLSDVELRFDNCDDAINEIFYKQG